MVEGATVLYPDSSGKEVQLVLRRRRIAHRPRDYCARHRLDVGRDHFDHPWPTVGRLGFLRQSSGSI